MGSPAYWGKLAAFAASVRKPGLKAFGLFNNSDNLGFIADMPGFGETFSQATQLYQSALNIDTSAANIITVTLTGNVASSQFTYSGGTPPDGQWNYVRFAQDSTGGRTVVLPANLTRDPEFAIDSGANRVTVLPVQWTGSGWVFFGEPFSTPTT